MSSLNANLPWLPCNMAIDPEPSNLPQPVASLPLLHRHPHPPLYSIQRCASILMLKPKPLLQASRHTPVLNSAASMHRLRLHQPSLLYQHIPHPTHGWHDHTRLNIVDDGARGESEATGRQGSARTRLNGSKRMCANCTHKTRRIARTRRQEEEDGDDNWVL